MKQKIFEIVLCGMMLCGCMNSASMNYVLEEYKGIPIKEVQTSDDTYRVFDKPDARKLMITPSLQAAAGQGFAQGLTLNSADMTPSKPVFERAAIQYLDESGRSGCRITESYVVLKPQWEMKYDCTPAQIVSATALSKRKH